MAETLPPPAPPFPTPSLEDLQHWTWVMGRAQQLMLEHMARQFGEAAPEFRDASLRVKCTQQPAEIARGAERIRWWRQDPAQILRCDARGGQRQQGLGQVESRDFRRFVFRTGLVVATRIQAQYAAFVGAPCASGTLRRGRTADFLRGEPW